MGGLALWARAQWLDRHRQLWREHDLNLALAWRPDDDSTPRAAAVIVLPEVAPAVVLAP